jgi:hypothetical protein
MHGPTSIFWANLTHFSLQLQKTATAPLEPALAAMLDLGLTLDPSRRAGVIELRAAAWCAAESEAGAARAAGELADRAAAVAGR